MENKIMSEICNFCEGCPSHEYCPEEECVLFRIEKLLEKRNEKKYKIEIEEILTKVVEVEAASKEDAYNKVYEKYREEEIVLTADDCEETKFYALNEDNDRVCEF